MKGLNKKSAKTGSQKRWIRTVRVLCVLCILGVGGYVGWKKRIGIVNTISRLTGIPVSYRLVDSWIDNYGYDTQVIKAQPARENILWLEKRLGDDGKIATTVPEEIRPVKESVEIDELLEQEKENGYSLEDPLVVMNPFGYAPLTAVAIFETPEACRVRCRVKGKTVEADLTFEVSEQTTKHRVPILGLYPDYTNLVELELMDEAGKPFETRTVEIRTEALPERLEDAVRPVKTSGTSAIDLTLVSGQRTRYPFAYDCMGDIRWYMNWSVYNTYPLSNGRLLMLPDNISIPGYQRPMGTNLYEIDYQGRVYKQYLVAGGLHHEVVEKEPGGNLLVLSNTMDLHCEDLIQELDRNTGEVVNQVRLLDVIGTGYYEDRDDFAHLNTISYDPETDTMILSPRNLESAIKINWTSHELIWILGNPLFWEKTDKKDFVLTPTEDFVYHFQQHSVYRMDVDMDGNDQTVEIMMFDNHYVGERKNQIDYFENTGHSYILVYSVDEKARTVSQIKKIPMVLSSITSNVFYREEAGHIFGMCGTVYKPDNGREGMTYEFDYETEEIINQYDLKNTFYRAVEMSVDTDDLSGSMQVSEPVLCGNLWAPVKVDKEVKAPAVSTSEVFWSILGDSVLLAGALDHQISQVIFKGENGTFVYDVSGVRLHDSQYLEFPVNVPIPVTGLDADTYQIWCVYKGTLCDTGHSLTVGA